MHRVGVRGNGERIGRDGKGLRKDRCPEKGDMGTMTMGFHIEANDAGSGSPLTFVS